MTVSHEGAAVELYTELSAVCKAATDFGSARCGDAMGGFERGAICGEILKCYYNGKMYYETIL